MAAPIPSVVNKVEASKKYIYAKRLREANRLISQAYATSAKELDLRRLNLTELPKSLFSLSSLEVLYLSGNSLTVLPDDLLLLKALKYLVVSNNQLKELPKSIGQLAELKLLTANNNKLKSLPESLGQIKNLHSLVVSGNRLVKLPESIGQLKQLQSIGLAYNRFTTFPDCLSKLSGLVELGLKNNSISSVPESLGLIKSLQRFDVSENELTSLPESTGELTQLKDLFASDNKLVLLPKSLGQLTLLQRLDLTNNKLTSLPESLQRISSLQGMYLHGNEGFDIPVEVLGPTFAETAGRSEKPQPPSSILDYYFRTRQGRRRLNEAKLILVGRGGSGKTSLVKRLLHDKFSIHEVETPGIDIQQWKIRVTGSDVVRLHVWDFGGQRILHGTHQFFLTERTLYLLVLSGREDSATHDAEYWLQLIKSFGSNSKVIIALNKSKQHAFDVNRGLLLEKYPFIADFVRTDCADGTGLKELEKLIHQQTATLEHRKTAFPAEWFTIKERLAGMQENFVSWDAYQEICREYGETNLQAQRDLARFLHILGIALHYANDPRLHDTRVLKPTWVTEGIYTLLRAGQKSNTGGIISPEDLARVLDKINYPPAKYDFLLGLMEKFQICFPLPGKNKQYLVPELLGENQPDIKELLDVPGLGFRYQYEVLPEGLLPRFVVQTHIHSEERPELRWRTGVVLSRDGCRAVVRADVRERRVNIHIVGPERQRRDLLAIIREKFTEQHRDLKGLVVDERVPVLGAAGVTVSFRKLLSLEERGIDEYEPESMDHPLSVQELLNGVESLEERAKRREQPQDGSLENATATLGIENRTMKTQKLVFISYCHKDAKFLNEFLVHLKPLERNGGLTKWSDKQITPGSKWFKEIKAAMAETKVAIMMVSPGFLASDFINEHELGPLLKEAEQGGVKILWIPVRACSYKETPLKNYQSVISPDKSLAQMKAERDVAWVTICAEVKKAIES
ncbi:MAG: COR domain-containing protein, partial [Limisphaerales bacterium]